MHKHVTNVRANPGGGRVEFVSNFLSGKFHDEMLGKRRF